MASQMQAECTTNSDRALPRFALPRSSWEWTNVTRVCLRTITHECLEASGSGVCYDQYCERALWSHWCCRSAVGRQAVWLGEQAACAAGCALLPGCAFNKQPSNHRPSTLSKPIQYQHAKTEHSRTRNCKRSVNNSSSNSKQLTPASTAHWAPAWVWGWEPWWLGWQLPL